MVRAGCQLGLTLHRCLLPQGGYSDHLYVAVKSSKRATPSLRSHTTSLLQDSADQSKSQARLDSRGAEEQWSQTAKG